MNIADLIVVHARNSNPLVRNLLPGTTKHFRWLIDILVPCRLLLYQDTPSSGAPFDQSADIWASFDEICEPFLRALQERFSGWTDFGEVGLRWVPLQQGSDVDHYRFVCRRMLIATDDDNWRRTIDSCLFTLQKAAVAWSTAHSNFEFPLGRIGSNDLFDK